MKGQLLLSKASKKIYSVESQPKSCIQVVQDLIHKGEGATAPFQGFEEDLLSGIPAQVLQSRDQEKRTLDGGVNTSSMTLSLEQFNFSWKASVVLLVELVGVWTSLGQSRIQTFVVAATSSSGEPPLARGGCNRSSGKSSCLRVRTLSVGGSDLSAVPEPRFIVAVKLYSNTWRGSCPGVLPISL